jgi:transposase
LDLTPFLPHLAGLSLAHVLVTDEVVTLSVAAGTPAAICPLCGSLSDRVQSRYRRTVADRPWGQRRVVFAVRVRRFCCLNAACPRRIFAERFPTLAAPFAQRTACWQADLRALGLALGGRAGARLASQLGLAVSHDTILRLAASAPDPTIEPPRVVGIDDFAFRRGRAYGTLAVDLERRRPIAVPPDRSAATVGRWLATFPGIEVVVRDRYHAYAAAAAAGAPQAVQVVDRFHLLTNLGDAVQDFLFTKTAVLRQVRRQVGEAAGPLPDAGLTAAAAPPWRQRLEEAGRVRQQRRIDQYRRVHELRERGAYVHDIATTLGVGRRTVYRYLHMPEPPPVPRPYQRARQPMLAPYRDHLLRRWDEGCRNAMRLWREIRGLGFPGSSSVVSKLLARWRREQRAGQRPTPLPPATQRLSVRRATLLLTRRPERLHRDERALLDQLCALDPAIAVAHGLARDFAALLRGRRGEEMDAWIARAEGADIAHLRRFALGLRGDPAVRAGLTEAWSNGQTEGHVGRLKYLKRQGYGRAGLTLLRARVLAVA